MQLWKEKMLCDEGYEERERERERGVGVLCGKESEVITRGSCRARFQIRRLCV